MEQLGHLVAATAKHHDNQDDPNAAVVAAEVTKTHYVHLALPRPAYARR
jgi:hypothetical protein